MSSPTLGSRSKEEQVHPRCNTHDKEFHKFCEDCKALFCEDCQSHQTHIVMPIEEAASFYREKLRKQLEVVEEEARVNKKKIESSIAMLNTEEVIVAEEIRYSARKLQEFLEEKKVTLLEQVNDAASMMLTQITKAKEGLNKVLDEVDDIQKFFSEITSNKSNGNSSETDDDNISDNDLKLLENASQIFQRITQVLDVDLDSPKFNPDGQFEFPLPEEQTIKELIAHFGEIGTSDTPRAPLPSLFD
eukprot:TRINITY_DN5495_c0_g1_i1.p1 TRINITY_DN5495_c0_g1~~TRINITY_DN5495_c0_g1_i1.p1  ORF type:complete len:246 (-),score=41.54 TRINITY_DN5495_c0_g1_i1:130-867(-)